LPRSSTEWYEFFTMKLIKQYKITNDKGLHARASAKFVEVVEKFDAKVSVIKEEMEVSGDSIMGLLMLAASKGSVITLRIDGPQANLLDLALGILIESKFGEDS
jgi:phosphocarrier protein HPr